MNSGKSIEILKVAHNYEEQNKPVLLFTSGIDTRDEVGVVSSRIGLRSPATAVFPDTNIYEIVKNHNDQRDGHCRIRKGRTNGISRQNRKRRQI